MHITPRSIEFKKTHAIVCLFSLICLLAVAWPLIAHAASLQGTVLENDTKNRKVLISADDGTSRVLFLPTQSSISISISIDGRPAQLKEIKLGMAVSVTYTGTNVKTLEAFSTTQSGQITPGSSGLTIEGELIKADTSSLTVRLYPGKDVPKTYAFSSATVFTKQGTKAAASWLSPGDRLKITVSSAGSTFAESVAIETITNKVTGIYRGKIEFFDKSNAGVAMSSLELLKNGKWTSVPGPVKKFYFQDKEIFGILGTQKIGAWKLPLYKGSTAYVIAGDFYSKATVLRLILKNQSESIFVDKVNQVSSSILQLKNGRNIAYDEGGTAFIINGRLYDRVHFDNDQYNIIANRNLTDADALVLSGGSGKMQIADIINIESGDFAVTEGDANMTSNAQYACYTGGIDYLLFDRIRLKNPLRIDANDWRGYSPNDDIYYDNDTLICDAATSSTAISYLSGDQFFKQYAAGTNNGIYVYIVAENDRAMAVVVSKLPPTSDQAMQGTLRVLPTLPTNASITIDDASLWNSGRTSSRQDGTWTPSLSTYNLWVDQAAIIRNGKAIKWEDIKDIGDNVYVIRDGNTRNAKIIIIK